MISRGGGGGGSKGAANQQIRQRQGMGGDGRRQRSLSSGSTRGIGRDTAEARQRRHREREGIGSGRAAAGQGSSHGRRRWQRGAAPAEWSTRSSGNAGSGQHANRRRQPFSDSWSMLDEEPLEQPRRWRRQQGATNQQIRQQQGNLGLGGHVGTSALYRKGEGLFCAMFRSLFALHVRLCAGRGTVPRGDVIP